MDCNTIHTVTTVVQYTSGTDTLALCKVVNYHTLLYHMNMIQLIWNMKSLDKSSGTHTNNPHTQGF